MSSENSAQGTPCEKLDLTRVDARVLGCACLPYLSTIDSAFRELLHADQRCNLQIAEIMRRDPSLKPRFLRLVNAVHYATGKLPRNIDEVVSYLGVRQIRHLSMVTQIIEDFEKLAQGHCFPWREFWRHDVTDKRVKALNGGSETGSGTDRIEMAPEAGREPVPRWFNDWHLPSSCSWF
jgi:hypothetical protein